MLEPVTIPILMKAIDFLFNEGHKILQEHREGKRSAQQKNDSMTQSSSTEERSRKTVDQFHLDENQIKDDFIHRRISQAVWSEKEAEIGHLLSLVEIQSRNYRLSKEQYAKWGSALVPPIIVNNLEESEKALVSTIDNLRSALSSVYGEPIIIPDLDS